MIFKLMHEECRTLQKYVWQYAHFRLIFLSKTNVLSNIMHWKTYIKCGFKIKNVLAEKTSKVIKKINIKHLYSNTICAFLDSCI